VSFYIGACRFTSARVVLHRPDRLAQRIGQHRTQRSGRKHERSGRPFLKRKYQQRSSGAANHGSRRGVGDTPETPRTPMVFAQRT
jgi:hypothetical protein